MKSSILGIDIGSSRIKCGMFNLYGKEVFSESDGYVCNNIKSGYIEINPEIIWQTVVKIIKRITSTQKNKYCIIGIGLCGIMVMPVLIDKENKVIRNIIHWQDERLYKQSIELKKKGIDKIIKENIKWGYPLDWGYHYM